MGARGWRERIEAGVVRAHRVACPSNVDRKPKRRCQCPFEIDVPGYQPGRTRTLTVVGPLAEARATRRRLMAEGRPEVPRAQSDAPTVQSLAAAWFDVGERQWSPATLAARDFAFRKRIAPTFGTSPVVSLTPKAVEAWAAALLAGGHGRRAVEIAVETLRALLTVAVDAEVIPRNPAAKVRLPAPPPQDRTPEDRIVDRDGAARLIAACRGPKHETIVRAALEAGLRRGEIAGLRWPDVRLEERRLVVRQAVYQSAKTGKVVRTPKSGRVGRVAISDAFAEALADWYAISVVRGGAGAAEFVWPSKGGGPMSPSSITHLIATLGRRAGLVDTRGRHVAHLHGLRHSAGSIALSEGVPLTVVSRSLRHSRPDFTARVYSHVLNDQELDRFAAAHEARPPDQTPTSG